RHLFALGRTTRGGDEAARLLFSRPSVAAFRQAARRAFGDAKAEKSSAVSGNCDFGYISAAANLRKKLELANMSLSFSLRSLALVVCVLLLSSPASAAGPRRRRQSPAFAPRPAAPMQLTYPASQKTDHVDDYHGTKIADPYRWLEDLDSDETRKWVEAQNKVTFAWLSHVPARESIHRRLTELWNYERYGLPHKKGGRYFYTRNDGLQNQNAVYVVDRLDGSP